MLSPDWKLPSRYPLCVYADIFHRTIAESVFAQIAEDTAPELLEAAQSHLLLLKEELEKQRPPFHYASQFGTHLCVGEVYLEASMRLRIVALMQPEPPAPTPEREPLLPEEVVNNLENTLQADIDKTFLGEERGTGKKGGNQA